jgi:hypothetical protein
MLSITLSCCSCTRLLGRRHDPQDVLNCIATDKGVVASVSEQRSPSEPDQSEAVYF